MAELFGRVRLEAMLRDGWTPMDIRDLIKAYQGLLDDAEARPTLAPGETLRLACDLCPACWARLQRAVEGGRE